MSTRKPDMRRRKFQEPNARTTEDMASICAKADRMNLDGYTLAVSCKRYGTTPETVRKWRKDTGKR